MDRVETIRQLISEALSPTQLDIVDESHFHKGHPGAASGAGHFNVAVVSQKFESQATLARHRMVYAAVGTLMPTEIHALSIKALTPEEYLSAKA
jgi:BolA protein